jgi:hypothetical protein
MLHTTSFRTLRTALGVTLAGVVGALSLQFALTATPSESRICVGAMQTTACVPPA